MPTAIKTFQGTSFTFLGTDLIIRNDVHVSFYSCVDSPLAERCNPFRPWLVCFKEEAIGVFINKSVGMTFSDVNAQCNADFHSFSMSRHRYLKSVSVAT
jgi:hypothetical protein